ncbi:unnamed protein product [Agarophyton chilense]
MHHPSCDVTESITPVYNSSTTRQPQKWNVPRVKLHPVKTTPVTHSARTQPFRVRVQPLAKQDELIRRQLFPSLTPRKRKSQERVNIRLNCGRERTQPLRVNVVRDSDGSLTSFLRDCVSQAEERIHAFHSAVYSKRFTKSVLENNLLFRILRREGDLFFVEHFGSDNNTIAHCAVLASGDVLSLAEYDPEAIESYMFIPQPWQSHGLQNTCHCTMSVLIVPYRITVTNRREILQALQENSLNQTLKGSLRSVASVCSPLLISHGDGKEVTIGHPKLDTFSRLSPHTTIVNLQVYVDFSFDERDFAVIRDNAGELAILMAFKDVHIVSKKGDRQLFRNVHVLPQRVTLEAVLDVVTLESSECHNQLIQSSQENLFAFSVRKPE